ncbi:MAG: amino acid permease [Planctomycetota bacterium]
MSKQSLGVFSLTALVVASMIGAGVFTSSGFLIADLPDRRWVLAAWLVGGIIAYLGAHSYGLLAVRLTENGGEYLYLSRFVHPAFGFVAGWVSLLAGFTGAAALAAISFESYVAPTENTGLPQGIVAIVLVLIATLTHAFHTRRGAVAQGIFVAIKLGLLLLFIVFSFSQMQSWNSTALSSELNNTTNHWPSFFVALTWISLSYSGFNAAVYVAGEATGGAKVVSKAMRLATVTVAIIYLLLNWIFLYAPEANTISGQKKVAAIAAEAIGGDSLSVVVSGIIGLGLATSVSSILLAVPRVYDKMARDGLFPNGLRSSSDPPTKAILLQGLAICVLIPLTGLQQLLFYLGSTLLVCSAATVATLLVTKADEATPSHWRSKVIPGLYVGAVILVAGVTAWTRPFEMTGLLATIVSGLVVFALQRLIQSPKDHSNTQ